MNSKLTTLLVASTLVLFSSCGKQESDSEKIEAKTKMILDDLNKKYFGEDFLNQGGQPGTVSVYGALVSEDGKLNEKINLDVKAGLNSTGQRGDLAEGVKPALFSRIDTVDLKAAIEDSSVLTIGCDQASSEKLAQDRQLKLKGIIETTQGEKTELPIINQTAKVIKICGDTRSLLKSNIINITADEIILENAAIKIQDVTGAIDLKCNTLTLVGKNLLETHSSIASGLISLTPNINVAVLKNLVSEKTEDILTIRSVGTDTQSNR